MKYEEETGKSLVGPRKNSLWAKRFAPCLGEFHVDTNQPLTETNNHYLSGCLSSGRVSLRFFFKKLTAQEGFSRQGWPIPMPGKVYPYPEQETKHWGWQNRTGRLCFCPCRPEWESQCLRRPYAIGIWKEWKSHDLETGAVLIENTEKLAGPISALPSPVFWKLYPWFCYYFLQIKGDLGKAQQCCKAIADLSKNTGNSYWQSDASDDKNPAFV